jgi:hypothetical protein
MLLMMKRALCTWVLLPLVETDRTSASFRCLRSCSHSLPGGGSAGLALPGGVSTGRPGEFGCGGTATSPSSHIGVGRPGHRAERVLT